MLPPRARVRTPRRCGSLEASDRGRPHCHEHEQKDGCELLSTTQQFTTSGLSVALIYDDGQRNRLNKQDRRRPETARPDSAPLTSRNMKRSGWRSAKTDASCGEKTSANEKSPVAEAARDFQKLPEIDSGGECETQPPNKINNLAP